MLLHGLLIAGALLGLVLTQYCSRRRFLIGSFMVLVFCLVVLAFTPYQQVGMLLGLFGMFTLTISAVSNLVGVFPAESFPTDIRSLGVGFVTSMSRLGSAIGTGLLPLSVLELGIRTTTLILALILLLGAWISLLWAPETKGVTLVCASQVKKKEPHAVLTPSEPL